MKCTLILERRIEFYNKIDEKLMTNAIETIITEDDDVDLPE
jgi:hypothetical protein